MKLLKDPSGVYLVRAWASIHPVPIRGEARDQTKITAVHTSISTIGGQTHNTTIPFDEAEAAFEAEYPAVTPPAS